MSRYYDFKFNTDDDPYIQVIVPTEHSHCEIAMDPMAARVNIIIEICELLEDSASIAAK